MPHDAEANQSGQPDCDCIGCRLALSLKQIIPESPTDDERARILGALLAQLAREIVRHPEPMDQVLMEVQTHLIVQSVAMKAVSNPAGAVKH